MAINHITRRQAIRIMALSGLALGLGAEELRGLVSGSRRIARVHETRLLMGTLATLTVITDQPDAARVAIAAALARMERLERIFSRFRSDSQVSILNRRGSVTSAAPELLAVLVQAVEYGEQTRGAFDVTVAPVLNAYREAAWQGVTPDQLALRDLKMLVDYRQITLRDDAISLRRSGMAITLDGLAKGYVLDAGADELLRHGCGDVLVEVGGDLMARGMTGNEGWKIAIQSPDATAAQTLLGTITVEDAALATSGAYRYQFTTAEEYHILDPRSGTSPAQWASVTVLAPDCCTADALSTALMVLNADAGLALIREHDRTAALFIDREGQTLCTDGFPVFDPAFDVTPKESHLISNQNA